MNNLLNTIKGAATKVANTVTGKKNNNAADVVAANPQLGGKRGRTKRYRKGKKTHRKHKKTHRKH